MKLIKCFQEWKNNIKINRNLKKIKRKSKLAQQRLPYKPTENSNKLLFGHLYKYLKDMYPNMSEEELFYLTMDEEDDFYDNYY